MVTTDVMTSLQDLTYTYDEANDIHITTLLKPTRRSMDDFVVVMNDIYRDLTDDDKVRVLVDYRQSGIPPIAYVVSKGREWASSLHVHPQARVAFVHRNDPLLRFLDVMVRSFKFGHLKTRFFTQENSFDDAIVWLQHVE